MSRISKLGRVLIAAGTIVLAGHLDALTIDVQKARKDAIQNKGEIVTNVTFDLDLPYGSNGVAGLVQPLTVNSTNQSGIVFGNQGTIYINTAPEYGLYRTASGKLAVSPATLEDYEAGTSWYKPITPAILKDILAPFTVKSVKQNGTVLTPDANGAVDVSVPTKLNDVCPEAENWIGVPGTTAAGKSIKILAKTVNGVIEGGLTVTGSSNNDNNTTKYRYNGVTVTRSGTATDYLFDSSQSGIARFSDLSGYVPITGGTMTGSLTAGDLGTIWGGTVTLTSEAGGPLIIMKDYHGGTWTIGYGFIMMPSGNIVQIPDANDTLALTSDIPTNVSSFNNDANYLTSESDPSVHDWAKAATKPSYTWSEISDTPTNLSAFNNDVNYIKLTEFKQAVLAAVTNDIPVINEENFTEEQLARSINEIAGALNRLRDAALEP